MPVKSSDATRSQSPFVQTSAVLDDPPRLNCPECGECLRHVRSEVQTHYFLCSRHGAMLIMLGGDVQRAEPTAIMTGSVTSPVCEASAQHCAGGTERPAPRST